MSIAKRISRLTAGLRVYGDARLLGILCLGLASGLPAPLIFANLSIWLADEGISRTSVAVFGMVATPYAVNFLWAPVFDHIAPPGLSRLGQRRGWLLILIVLLAFALVALGQQNPVDDLPLMAVCAVIAAAVSASLDIVVDAYRIEIMDEAGMGAASATGVFGWHIGGSVIGGAGGLLLASAYGWSVAYAVLAAILLVPWIAVLLIREPQAVEKPSSHQTPTHNIGHALRRAVFEPLQRLMDRPMWWQILAFIILFKLGEAMLGRMSGVFYREMGFDYETIAEVGKLYGVTATLVGGMLGGGVLRVMGIGRGLFVSGVLMAATNLLFAGLAANPEKSWFIFAVVGDGLTSGFALVAFVAFLSRLCTAGYAATQYALLASIGNFARIQMSGISGWLVDSLDGNWQVFFMITACFAVPGLVILAYLLLNTRMNAGYDNSVFSRTYRKR